MDFVLCENSNYKYLICQNISTKECWTLITRRYTFAFSDWTPPFIKLANMKITLISDKEAIKMLEKYASESGVQATKVKEFIERYKQLPF